MIRQMVKENESPLNREISSFSTPPLLQLAIPFALHSPMTTIDSRRNRC